MTTEARDRGQGDWHQLLDQTSSVGKLLAKPEYTIDQIMRDAKAIGVGHPRHDFLVNSTLWNVVHARAWNKEIPVEKALEVAKRMISDRSLGNSLADTGKYLEEQGGLDERAYAILRYAADVHTAVWDRTKEEGKLSMDLFEDYARVSGLQDWAGDSEGATKTAQAVVSRLLDWEETGALKDEDDHSLDCAKEEQLLYLRDPESPLYVRLFNSLRTQGARDRRNQMVAGQGAMGLLREGKIDEAFAQVQDGDSQISFTLRVIPFLADVIERGDRERATVLLDRFAESFPDQLKGSSVYLGFTPLIDVLVELDRYELLATMVQGTIAQEDDGEPYFGNADMYSMRAGAVIYNKKGLGRAEEFKGLLSDRLRDKAQEGIEIVQNPPEWLQ
jgi:hypothetical protein